MQMYASLLLPLCQVRRSTCDRAEEPLAAVEGRADLAVDLAVSEEAAGAELKEFLSMQIESRADLAFA